MKPRKGTLGQPSRRAAPGQKGPFIAGAGAFVAAACALWPAAASAEPTAQDYHYFRALSIDLQGRVPSRDELAAFEAPGFDIDGWLDQRLDSPLYAERVSRIYLDLLRLELPGSFTFHPAHSTLRRATILGPDGKDMYVYYRVGMRRKRTETDGVFCLTYDESGLQTNTNGSQTGTPIKVSQTALDQNTKLVKPWWLYRDYASATPKDLYGAGWVSGQPSYMPSATMLTDGNGQPTTQVRVCKEEAGAGEMGTVYTTGNMSSPNDPPPYNRIVPLPRDTKFAQEHSGEPIACGNMTAHVNAIGCGCGAGLERCVPGTSDGLDPGSFMQATEAPLGREVPFSTNNQSVSAYVREAWAVEAVAFVNDIVAQDKDFRDMLVSKSTVLNGPGVQFHRTLTGGTCCTDFTSLGYPEPTPLLDPAKLPSLAPYDTNQFELVDRGDLASGLLTMPIFLLKYGTRRARAHVLYNAFLCKEFTSTNSSLTASPELDLTKRSGCKDCHATLEPMSAYFARVKENDWTYLPPEQFPIKNPACKLKGGVAPGYCKGAYDPAFSDENEGTLRGAYSSAENANAGPAALAQSLVASDDFASCVVKNVTSSFLGRPLDVDDTAMQEELTKAFVGEGYHLRALVRTILKSDVYRLGNDRLNADEK